LADERTRRPVFLVSGGTGDTGRAVLKAALRQFGDVTLAVRTFPQLEDHELEGVFEQAAEAEAIVVSTFVTPDSRRRAGQLARATSVPYVDVLGPLLDELSGFLEQTPSGVAGLLHRADERYYDRIAAIEYTLGVDDGRNPRRLSEADIVLVGVSRTGKTPLSTFLAHKGFRVANQPIVLDQPFPKELLDIDQRRIFALTIDPERLQRIRVARMTALRMRTETSYSDLNHILAELEYAEKLYRSHRWPVLDVTQRAIEETAGLILKRLEEYGLVDASGDPTTL
jgi:regulator of PEP synthase PpsR (kinase-PPPase family)